MKISTSFIVTRDDVRKLEDELVDLHTAIRAIRAAMAPLNEEIDRANEEWHAAIQPLLLRAKQLAGEISRRRASRLQPKPPPDESQDEGQAGQARPQTEAKKTPGTTTPAQPISARPQSVRDRQEAGQKDQLLQFLVWVLADQGDRRNQTLMSTLTEMSGNRSVQLADMLEQIVDDLCNLQLEDEEDALGAPQDPAWTIAWFYQQHAGAEEDNMHLWYERLSIWRESLKQRHDQLEASERQQRSGDRYDRWLQYHQGPHVWQSYLEGQRSQMQRQVAKYEASLRSMG
jgi:hypothetical protein